MRKQLKNLVPFVLLLATSHFAVAQVATNTSIGSINYPEEISKNVNIKLKRNSEMKTLRIPTNYAAISIDESKFTFKASKDFGSYVIPNTNYLKIVASDGKVYSTAKLTEKKSKRVIFSINIDTDKSVIDMSFTKPGIYTLFLSNKHGDQYSEDILIM